MPAINLRVTGSVQGVFYRAATQEKAKELSLSGWVKNCPDGALEIFAEGSDEALTELTNWCHHGPDTAEVDGVEIKEVEEEGLKSFEIV
ncbi:MAG: acylphosphatase [Candidatus Peribacteraceae bacterium]|jgi:acylphosphatase|nr:acylphosphatase [Candidatus Peribacteraceae bacterium]HCI03723.1 acylphosphatase [Candidatus Peribacteria bacterium]|tara:strand:+ start:1773 stop:2039 length:267 start_codon:yes stop_codon:yes gene_type:complete